MKLTKKQKNYLLELLMHDLSMYALTDLKITEEEIDDIYQKVYKLKEVEKW